MVYQPDIAQSLLAGFQAYQQYRGIEREEERYEAERKRRERMEALGVKAAEGDEAALRQLYATDPGRAASVQTYLTGQQQRTAAGQQAERQTQIDQLKEQALTDPKALQALYAIDPKAADLIAKRIESQRGEADKLELETLRARAAQGDQTAMKRLLAIAPDEAAKIQKFGQTEEEQQFEKDKRILEETSQLAGFMAGKSPEIQIDALNWRINSIEARGGDATESIELRDMLSSGDPARIEEAQRMISNRKDLGVTMGIIKGPEPDTALMKELKEAYGEGTPEYKQNLIAAINKKTQPLSQTALMLQEAGIDPKSKKGREIMLAKLRGETVQMSIDPETGEFTYVSGTGLQGKPEMSKKVATKIEESILNSTDNLQRLARIREQYRPEFLTYKGRAQALWNSIKSKGGVNLTPEEREFTANRRKFIQNIASFFNVYRKEITGAAAAQQELKNLEKAIINPNLSPVEFEAALDEYERELKRSKRLMIKMQREGITGSLKKKGSDASDWFDAEYTTGGDDTPEARMGDYEKAGLIKYDPAGNITNLAELNDLLVSDGYLEPMPAKPMPTAMPPSQSVAQTPAQPEPVAQPQQQVVTPQSPAAAMGPRQQLGL